MGRGGEATGCLDGRKVFAAFGLPGERVELEVWERRPDRLWGRVVRVLRPSPHRVAPHCPYFGTCGGCQWQHVDYQRQLDFKTEMVATHLADGVGFANPPVLPTLPSPVVYGYRNHARFSIGRRHGELGFTTHYGHRFMRVDHCPIMHPRIDEVLAATQGRARGHQLAVRVGMLGLALAPYIRRVIGVEESAAALRDAHHNARDLANMEFVAGRTEEVL